jgi:hypothetical protein
LREVCSCALLPLLEAIQSQLVEKLRPKTLDLAAEHFEMILRSLEFVLLFKTLLAPFDRQDHPLYSPFVKPVSDAVRTVFAAGFKAMDRVLDSLKVPEKCDKFMLPHPCT